MKPYIILAAMGFAAVLLPWFLVSCTPRPLDVEPQEPAPLAVKMDLTDGIRTIDKVLRRPELVLTVVNGDDKAVYEAVFRINDGRERTVRSIWNGVPKDLSGELLSLSEYGPVTVKGYLYDTAVLTERVPLDTTLWIAYSPATRGDLMVKTQEREEPLSDGTVFTVGESGTLEIAYTPEDTFLHISLSVPEESPLVLIERRVRNEGGLYSIPFSVMAAGETVVTLTVANGRDQETVEYAITCKELEINENN